MQLKGSCHCGSVKFTVKSSHPYPYNLCYCSICRKTAGGGGYAINLEGYSDTLEVTGNEHISVYRAIINDADSGETKQSPGKRHFCSKCGSALWVWDPRWPELAHPFASAIDNQLPEPPEYTHLMLDFKANWVPMHLGPDDKTFNRYPDESIAGWHERKGLIDTDP
jgi:hypothetical protein